MEVRLPLGDESKLATAGLTRGAITRGEITQPGGGSSSQEDQQEPQKYPLSPFSLNRDETEHIGLGSGNLNLTVTDFVLPGKNGFDLKLTRTYNSMMANVDDLTVNFNNVKPYYWTLYFEFEGEDWDTQERGTCWVETQDDTIGYSTKKDAEQAAKDWIQVNGYNSKNNTVKATLKGEDREREFVVKGKVEKIDIDTPRRSEEVPISGLRVNDHLTGTYGLGLGWGFNFPSIEAVKTDNQRGGVKYYHYIHLEDGRVYPFTKLMIFQLPGPNDVSPIGRNLNDFTLLQGGPSGYTFTLKYKDGRIAYFNEMQDNSVRLAAMEDRFGNRISFSLNENGGTITDTMGRKLTLQKGNITDGYTLTWTLPDKSTIVYTVKTTIKASQTFPVLASVKDQAGRVTNYVYANYPANLGEDYRKGYLYRRLNSTNVGDNGVNVTYYPLTDITYPTGAKTQYIYKFDDGYDRDNLEGDYGIGSDAFLLLHQRKDHENGVQKNVETYTYSLGIAEKESGKPRYIDSVQMAAGERTEQYLFEIYNASASKHITWLGAAETGTKLCERISDTKKFYRQQLPCDETVKWYQGGNVLTRVNQWDYEPTGDVKSETRPLAGTTTITYDPTYYLMTAKEYKKDGGTTIREEYTLSADKKQITMKKVFEKSGSGAFALKEATQYQYDGNHNLTLERQYLNLSLAASAGDRVTRYSYHSNGVYLAKKWVTGLKDAWGAAQKDVSESYEYDACGRVTCKTDGEGRQTRYQYDGLGRVVQETRPGGYQRRTGYLDAQNRLIETDELGHQKRYDYTPLGKIAAVYTLSPDVLQASYAYDNRDRLITESAFSTAGTATTSYRYDHYDRVLEKKITGTGLPEYKEIYSYHDAYQNAYSMESKTVVGPEPPPPT